MIRRALVHAVVLNAVLCAAAQACSVCAGDPESSMTQGAMRGVIALGVIVYGVLFGMGGVAITWFVRARRLAAAEALAANGQPPVDPS